MTQVDSYRAYAGKIGLPAILTLASSEADSGDIAITQPSTIITLAGLELETGDTGVTAGAPGANVTMLGQELEAARITVTVPGPVLRLAGTELEAGGMTVTAGGRPSWPLPSGGDDTDALNTAISLLPDGTSTKWKVVTWPANQTYLTFGQLNVTDANYLEMDGNGCTIKHEIQLPVHTVSGVGQITSAGLFTTDMQGQPINGTGIPSGTVCRAAGFVDASHMNISQNATATGNITAHIAPIGRTTSHWSLLRGSNQRYHDFTLDGNNLDGGYTLAIEAQHGFNIAGTNNVEIDSNTISHIYGDSHYVTDYPTSIQPDTIHFHNNQIFSNGRQGLSVTCGSNIEVDHNTWTNLARAVNDFEIQSSRQAVDGWNFHHNTVNFHQLNFVSTGANTTPGVLKNVTIADNTAQSFGQIVLRCGFGGLRGSNFAFVRNTQSGTYHDGATPGCLIDIWNVDGVIVGGGAGNVNANTIPLSTSSVMYAVIASNCTNRTIAGNVLTPTSNSNQSLARIRSYAVAAPIPATTGTTMTIKDPGVTLPAVPFTFDIRPHAPATGHQADVEHCTCTSIGTGTNWTITRGTAYSGGITVNDPILLT